LSRCFWRNNVLFTGTQGEAPDLWNCTFASGVGNDNNCFENHNVSSLSNYGDIPSAWK